MDPVHRKISPVLRLEVILQIYHLIPKFLAISFQTVTTTALLLATFASLDMVLNLKVYYDLSRLFQRSLLKYMYIVCVYI